MKVITGSDHAGLALKIVLVERMRAKGIEVEDVGTHTNASCDYPDFAVQVARSVAGGQADFGLLVCGTGQGMAMTANRVAGIRAAVVADTFTARSTREHNDANVLCLGERVLGPGLAGDILDLFLATPFAGGRHAGRVNKFMALDRAE
jgi:ribose 5-phosphate isomerase B